MRDLVELTEEEWFFTYKPIPNLLSPNPSFEDENGIGYMFETYGEELEFIEQQPCNTVWTYGDGDSGNSYIWSGQKIINRIGYFVTTVPFDESKDYQMLLTSVEEDEQ
jgi:hypothetical protein